MINFNPGILKAVADGKSALDLLGLEIHNLEAADSFVKAYGFDLSNDRDLAKVWYFYRRALVFMNEKLLFPNAEVPEVLREKKDLEDPRMLLIFASQTENKELQKWACALLRVMHTFVHIETDVFSSFADEIQKQILTPLEMAVRFEGSPAKPKFYTETAVIPLVDFQIKAFKTSSSSVIKLLAKPEALAINVYDKIGVRFVTKGIVDTFRLLAALVDGNILSFPHIIPDQSSNNLYPVEVFARALEETEIRGSTPEEAEEKLQKYWEEKASDISPLRKENLYSAGTHRFIKFIARKKIQISDAYSFFYPFEVQILDEESYLKGLKGDGDHTSYKQRQIQAARKRAFPQYAEKS